MKYSVRRGLESIEPYRSPHGASLLRLDTNSSQFGPSPAAVRLLHRRLPPLNEYPSTDAAHLRRAIASAFRVRPGNIIVGCGSDEVIDTIVKTFTNPGDAVAVPSPSFGMYRFYATVNCARTVEVPLVKTGLRWSLDPDAFLRTAPRVAFIPSPNNPTGNLFPVKDLMKVISGLEKSGAIAVIDEAYADFATARSLIPLVRRHPNLVVLRTFSKLYGLAGLRAGFAVAALETVEWMARALPPYTISVLSEEAAAAAVSDRGHPERVRRLVGVLRRRLGAGLSRLGFTVYPSDANFLLVSTEGTGSTSARIARGLLKSGIAVKDLSGNPALKDHLRITVGRPGQQGILLRALRSILD